MNWGKEERNLYAHLFRFYGSFQRPKGIRKQSPGGFLGKNIADRREEPPHLRIEFKEMLDYICSFCSFREQLIIRLRCEGKTYREIGRKMGVTIERVRVIFNRGIEKIREQLELKTPVARE